jgi:hypothetical protein
MISHNSLENRLNAIREGKEIPPTENPNASIKPNNVKPSPEEYKPPPLPQVKNVALKNFLLSEGYKIFGVLSASILYGYGIRSIFSSSWDFIGTLGIGFILNHFLTIMLKLLKK